MAFLFLRLSPVKFGLFRYYHAVTSLRSIVNMTHKCHKNGKSFRVFNSKLKFTRAFSAETFEQSKRDDKPSDKVKYNILRTNVDVEKMLGKQTPETKLSTDLNTVDKRRKLNKLLAEDESMQPSSNGLGEAQENADESLAVMIQKSKPCSVAVKMQDKYGNLLDEVNAQQLNNDVYKTQGKAPGEVKLRPEFSAEMIEMQRETDKVERTILSGNGVKKVLGEPHKKVQLTSESYSNLSQTQEKSFKPSYEVKHEILSNNGVDKVQETSSNEAMLRSESYANVEKLQRKINKEPVRVKPTPPSFSDMYKMKLKQGKPLAATRKPPSYSDLSKMEGRLELSFECKKCDTKNVKIISKHSYEKGIVIVSCDGCNYRHLVADNLNWYPCFEGKKNIEEYLASKGETVKRSVWKTSDSDKNEQ